MNFFLVSLKQKYSSNLSQIQWEIWINKIVCLIETNNYKHKHNLEKSILNFFDNYPKHYKQMTIKFLNKIPVTNNGKKLRDQKELVKLLT